MAYNMAGQLIHPAWQGYDEGMLGAGSALWLEDKYNKQQGQFDKLDQLADQMGQVKLDLPQFDVQKGDQYTRLFQSVGRREGDQAAQGVNDALASRGGGGLGASSALGAQARSSPNLQALSAGVGYDFQEYQKDLQGYMARLGAAKAEYGAEMGGLQAQSQGIQNAMSQRFTILNQIVGSHIGQIGANAQITSAMQAADAQVEAAIWNAAASSAQAAASSFG